MCPNTAIDNNPQAAWVAQPQHGMAPRFVVYAAAKDVDEQRVTQKFSLIEQGTHNTGGANEALLYRGGALDHYHVVIMFVITGRREMSLGDTSPAVMLTAGLWMPCAPAPTPEDSDGGRVLCASVGSHGGPWVACRVATCTSRTSTPASSMVSTNVCRSMCRCIRGSRTTALRRVAGAGGRACAPVEQDRSSLTLRSAAH